MILRDLGVHWLESKGMHPLMEEAPAGGPEGGDSSPQPAALCLWQDVLPFSPALCVTQDSGLEQGQVMPSLGH